MSMATDNTQQIPTRWRLLPAGRPHAAGSPDAPGGHSFQKPAAAAPRASRLRRHGRASPCSPPSSRAAARMPSPSSPTPARSTHGRRHDDDPEPGHVADRRAGQRDRSGLDRRRQGRVAQRRQHRRDDPAGLRRRLRRHPRRQRPRPDQQPRRRRRHRQRRDPGHPRRRPHLRGDDRRHRPVDRPRGHQADLGARATSRRSASATATSSRSATRSWPSATRSACRAP